MEMSGDSSLNILIPLFENKEMAIRAVKSAVTLKKLVNYKVNVIVSDDSKNRHIETFLKTINLYKDECIFICRDKNVNEENSAINNWNFLLNYSFILKENSHYMLLHHDEEICLRSFLKFSLSSDLIIVPLIGFTSRRNTSFGISIFKFIIKNFPKILYNFNIIGPSACFITNQKNTYNTNLKWLVDVDFYIRTINKLENRKKCMSINQNLLIKTHVNKYSITSKINVSKTLIEESRKLKIEQPYLFINYLISIYKKLKL